MTPEREAELRQTVEDYNDDLLTEGLAEMDSLRKKVALLREAAREVVSLCPPTTFSLRMLANAFVETSPPGETWVEEDYVDTNNRVWWRLTDQDGEA